MKKCKYIYIQIHICINAYIVNVYVRYMQNSRLKENGKIDIFLESQRNDTSLYISNSNK